MGVVTVHGLPETSLFLGSEALFRLAPLEIDGDHVAGAMPLGPWLAHDHGVPLVGALGVLVDDVLGYAMNRRLPLEAWSVSTEITIDMVGVFRTDPAYGPLQAATDAVEIGERRGRATGTVVDAHGATVAHCSQRGQWIPFPGIPDAPATVTDVDPGAVTIDALLGARPVATARGAELRLPVTASLANPLGNLHGGISLCVSDLVAAASVTTWDSPWSTESIRISYARPILVGGALDVTATVRHCGRSLAFVDVVGAVDGRLCTVATVTGRPTR